jgi:hypothetical protein
VWARPEPPEPAAPEPAAAEPTVPMWPPPAEPTAPLAPPPGSAPPPTFTYDAPASSPPAEPPRRGVYLPRWLTIVLALVLVAAIGYVIGAVTAPGGSSSSSASKSPANNSPTTTLPSGPSNPAVTQQLQQIGLQQGDLTSSVSLTLIPGGDQVSGQTTLDLCNGTFPSESLRRSRLQVAAVDNQGDAPISTEAVQYTDAAATQQAFSELQKVAANCPSGPVTSPVGEATVSTKFNAAPDGSWPTVAGVDRLAYDFVTTDNTGQSQHSVAVYLRRGKVLLAVYFSQPDGAQTAFNGQTTIQGIVNVLENRLAMAPTSLVGS